MFGSFLSEQVSGSFLSNINCQTEKTNADDSECYPLDSLTPVFVCISGHAPEKRDPRRDFDEAINTKAYERNAAGDYTRRDGYYTFEGVPRDGEVFEPSPALHDGSTFQSSRFRHMGSIQ